MVFESIYSALQDLFPQVDRPALKVAAIEHSEDIDAAVENVLEDMDTFFAEKHTPSSLSSRSTSIDDGNCFYAPNIERSTNVSLETSELERSSSQIKELLIDDDDFELNSEASFSTPRGEEDNLGRSFADFDDLVDETTWVEVTDMQESDLDYSTCLDDRVSNGENSSNIGVRDDESTSNTILSLFGQTQVIDDLISDARNKKETLHSSMEDVISLMQLVEAKEQAAGQTKVEAISVGILNQVAELKKMLEYANEGNNMDAGEVYGEKAILATELRELHFRAYSLSNERDKTLGVLDEMRETLEVKLSELENEIKSAEEEKRKRTTAAQKLFAEQELVMEGVVRESMILKKQAEENAKLQEFLTDRGRVVDALQGELAVVYEDVRVLKERFDKRIPLGKSPFPYFVMAFSNSNSISLVPDTVD